MIEPTGYRAGCDHPGGCTAEWRGPTYLDLIDAGEKVGWTFNRKADGSRAKRNGSDYCPVHRRGWHLLDGLTDHMADRLVDMLEAPNWRPRGAGEWRSARMMHARGLLSRWTGDGSERYSLNDAGRRAGLDIKARLGEIAAATEPTEDNGDDSE